MMSPCHQGLFPQVTPVTWALSPLVTHVTGSRRGDNDGDMGDIAHVTAFPHVKDRFAALVTLVTTSGRLSG